jgi:WD40 repeat protein
LISGGKDGKIIVWNTSGEGNNTALNEKHFDLKSLEVKSFNPRVKSICEHPQKGHILVGSRGGEIIEFGGKKTAVLVKSHFDKELCGLAPHPKKAEFLTVGQDGILGVWDMQKKRQTRYAKLECGADAVAYSNSG